MKLDVRSIVQFVAVAETLSFRKASDRLGLPQPWLSQRIRLLEEQLGFPLFVRSTRRVELTEEGRALLADAAAVAAAARATEQTAEKLRSSITARLRVGVPPYYRALRRGVDIFQRFFADRPNITLEMDVGWSPTLRDKLVNRDIDFAVLLDAPEHDALTYRPLNYCRLMILAPEGDRISRTSPLTVADLKDCDISVFTRGLNPALYDKLYTPLAAAGARLRQIPEFEDLFVGRYSGQPYRYAATLHWSDEDMPTAKGMSMKILTDVNVRIPILLARRTEPAGRLHEEFWRFAEGLVDAQA